MDESKAKYWAVAVLNAAFRSSTDLFAVAVVASDLSLASTPMARPAELTSFAMSYGDVNRFVDIFWSESHLVDVI